MTKIFLDTNTIIDYFDSSRKDHFPAVALISNSKKKYKLICSLKTVLDTYYILGERNKARKSVELISNICEVIPGKNQDLKNALILKDWKDLEDAFQYSIAIENKVDYIVTNDKKGFKKSDIPVCNADNLNQMLNIKL